MQSVEWRFLPFEHSAEQGVPFVEVQMVPFIDGKALTAIVAEFERSHRLKPSGRYGGLLLSEYRLGDLRQYLRGKQQPWPGARVQLLGCECGDWGCWPFIATVRREGKAVMWTEFEQPFRKGRGYSELGPFAFDVDQYRAAVDAAAMTAT